MTGQHQDFVTLFVQADRYSRKPDKY
jgi:hypothetical protein